jgi:hypothetical protein
MEVQNGVAEAQLEPCEKTFFVNKARMIKSIVFFIGGDLIFQKDLILLNSNKLTCRLIFVLAQELRYQGVFYNIHLLFDCSVLLPSTFRTSESPVVILLT